LRPALSRKAILHDQHYLTATLFRFRVAR
jgi:hypothetical protein